MSTIPEQRQRSAMLYGSMLLLRITIGFAMLWVLNGFPHLEMTMNSALTVSILVYLSASVLLGISLLKSPNLYLAQLLYAVDFIFALCMIWMIPNNAMLGFSIPLVLFSAVLIGYRAFGLILFSAMLFAACLFSAYWHQTLADSLPMPIHILQGIFGLMAIIFSLKLQSHNPQMPVHETDPQTNLPYFSVLRDGFTYLLPYHQRNRIPLSLLMIRLPERSALTRDELFSLCEYIAQRLRKSDLMVRFDQKHLAVLLCDTSDHGAFLLAQALQQYIATEIKSAAFYYAVLRVPLENASLEQLLQKMQDALSFASQHDADRIVFVSHD
ncbi:MAG: hypothetical protein VXW65_06475 [Pseudomonadota bacterium]|nr:hypothetical protein [Pseudomonadota bacterium]